MAAKPKVGKSTAARHLALAVSRGEEWLGRNSAKGMVWYLAFEGRRRDVKAHFAQMGAHVGDDLRVWTGSAPRNVIEDLHRLATTDRPALIIIDTMQRFLRAKSTDDYAEMTQLLEIVITIAQESGATMLLLHHSGKSDRAPLDQVLGSTAITGSADTIIVLARTERYRTITTIQRVGDDLDETVLLLDDDTGRVRLGGSRAVADQESVGAQLLKVLASAGEPLTRDEWFKRVEARTMTKTAALRSLEAGNRITRTGPGTRNGPYRYSVAQADSCSLVPYKEREQETSKPPIEESEGKTNVDSCSDVPAPHDCCSGKSSESKLSPNRWAGRLPGPGEPPMGISTEAWDKRHRGGKPH